MISRQAESKPKSTKGLKPKILDESPPAEAEEPEGVKKHNKEMENRHEKAHAQIGNEEAEKDKVSPDFWTGMFQYFNSTFFDDNSLVITN
jgi:hypothetical protein